MQNVSTGDVHRQLGSSGPIPLNEDFALVGAAGRQVTRVIRVARLIG
jgi:hypothetical protein